MTRTTNAMTETGLVAVTDTRENPSRRLLLCRRGLEHFHGLAHERRQVRRLARSHQVPVHHHFPVFVHRAGLLQLGGHGTVTGGMPALEQTGRNQRLRAVADGGHGLVLFEEVPGDLNSPDLLPHRLGRLPSRKHENIVVIGPHLVQRHVRFHFVAVFSLHCALFHGRDVHLDPFFAKTVERHEELRVLEVVRADEQCFHHATSGCHSRERGNPATPFWMPDRVRHDEKRYLQTLFTLYHHDKGINLDGWTGMHREHGSWVGFFKQFLGQNIAGGTVLTATRPAKCSSRHWG